MSRFHRTASAALAATLSFAALASGGPVPPASSQTATTGTAPISAQERGGHDDAIQRRLDRLVSRSGFPGVIATVRGGDGKIRTYRAGAGDLETGRPIPRDARVRIASNTKMFTATVVLQLVAEGLVDLDAAVERYLPGVVRGHGNDGRHITVRQLLQQTSGLPDYDGLVIAAGGTLRSVAHTYYEPHDLLDASLAERRHFQPGARWEYSNTNYVVLGLLVERVTGRPVSEEVERRIIDRIGLEDTYWPEVGEQRIRGSHPRGYLADEPDGRWHDLTWMDPSLGWAAGQLVATPRDLGLFMEALLDGDLLPAAQLRELRKTVKAPGFDVGRGWRYGLGVASHRLTCGVRAWGHGGDIHGFETRNLITDDGRWAVVTVNALPTSLRMATDVGRAVDAAICQS